MKKLARPERIELPTYWFEASRSIRLSYGREQTPLYADTTRTQQRIIIVVGHNSVETEIKLRVSDPSTVRTLLEQHHFAEVRPRVFESNTLFDTPDRTLKRRGDLMRVRRAGDRSVLTFKSADLPGRHKRREEIETDIADASSFETILARLGYVTVFRYEKYRTEFARSNEPGIITLDETPIGTFLELEGSPEWIDSTAHELRFTESDYILNSYGSLYLEYCRRSNLAPENMVFSRSGEPV